MKKLLIALFLFLTSSIHAVVTLNTTASAQGNAASFTVSTTVATGSNRVMLLNVGVRTSDALIIDGLPTFNGVNFTLENTGQYGGTFTGAFYSLIAPAEVTADVVVTLTGANKTVISILVYDGVSALGALSVATDSGTSITNNLTTLAADSMIAHFATHRMDSVYTKDANYTSRTDVTNTGNPANSKLHGLGEDRLVTTAQNYTVTSALDSFVIWEDVLQELQDGVGPTPTPTPVPGPSVQSLQLLGIGKPN